MDITLSLYMSVCMRALMCCFAYCISQQNPVSPYLCRNCQDPEIRSGHDLWRGWEKKDGLTASCKAIATRTIVIDGKFIQW